MKKTAFALLTLATITLSSCYKETYTTKNDAENSIDVTLFADGSCRYDMNSAGDSTIKIFNSNAHKSVAYINFANSASLLEPSTLVDRIVVKGKPFIVFSHSKVYNRGDEGTEQLFADADKDYRNKVNFVIDERKKAKDAEIQGIKDVVYK